MKKKSKGLEEMKKLGSSPESGEGPSRKDDQNSHKHFGQPSSKKQVPAMFSDGLSDEDFADLEE